MVAVPNWNVLRRKFYLPVPSSGLGYIGQAGISPVLPFFRPSYTSLKNKKQFTVLLYAEIVFCQDSKKIFLEKNRSKKGGQSRTFNAAKHFSSACPAYGNLSTVSVVKGIPLAVLFSNGPKRGKRRERR